MDQSSYKKGFLPYALAALLIGLVGGFSAVLGPAFVQDIGIAYNNTTWTALAQAVAAAACAPVLGKIGDIFGRERTLLIGVAVFTLGNILSAVAGSLLFMMAARFTVGVGMAAMSPVIIAYIATEFPKEKVTKGFSLYMLLSSASVVIGPTVGSIIIASHGWRSMMWLCAAFCSAVLAFCFFTCRGKSEVKKSLRGFDIGGAVLIPIFFGLLLCLPTFGQNYGWSSAPFLLSLAASCVSLFALIAAERRAEHPIISGRFIMRRAFVFSIVALFLTQGLMQANMTNTIVFVGYTMPGNNTLSGYAISVMYIGMALGAVLIGPQADRFGPRRVLAASFALTGLGCGLLLAFKEVTPLVLMMTALGVLGLGLGGNATIFLKVVLSGLTPAEAGAGTGTYGLFRDLAAPFGVAVLVPLFTNGITGRIAEGMTEAAAAVSSVRFLAVAEIISVAIGIGAVLLLPGRKKEEKNEA